MVAIEGGVIEMRDDRLDRRWTLQIEPVALGKYPVTQDLYFEVTGLRPSTFMGERLPVETVTWRDAVVFCNRLSLREGLEPCYAVVEGREEVGFDPLANGYRLPTEAEWQYACRAGTSGIRYGDLETVAWYKGNSEGKSHPVGQKAANAWGLHDMLGNVWEWCNDIYDATVYGSYRIFRGGGWCDEARSVMATTRRRSHPFSFKIDDLGFRLARNGEADAGK